MTAIARQSRTNAQVAWNATRDEARACTRCSLHLCGSQTVFGEGPLDAALMLVGEQPGNQEDLAGRPFVGPAGRVLDEALSEAGLDRARIYITNAVKHFKFMRRGKRRLHQKPDAAEIKACRFWLSQEQALVKPRLILAMGATAGRAVFGKPVTISNLRGQFVPLPEGDEAQVTVHPSFLLRLPDPERRAEERADFVRDLIKSRERIEAAG